MRHGPRTGKALREYLERQRPLAPLDRPSDPHPRCLDRWVGRPLEDVIAWASEGPLCAGDSSRDGAPAALSAAGA